MTSSTLLSDVNTCANILYVVNKPQNFTLVMYCRFQTLSEANSRTTPRLPGALSINSATQVSGGAVRGEGARVKGELRGGHQGIFAPLFSLQELNVILGGNTKDTGGSSGGREGVIEATPWSSVSPHAHSPREHSEPPSLPDSHKLCTAAARDIILKKQRRLRQPRDAPNN